MADEKRPVVSSSGDPKYTWEDTLAAIGQDFSGGEEQVADETISYTDMVRFCEPWEIGNPIYWDEAAAKQAGYRGVVVPWSAIKQTFAYNGFWRPGKPTHFPTQDPNAATPYPNMAPQGKELPKPPTSQEFSRIWRSSSSSRCASATGLLLKATSW